MTLRDLRIHRERLLTEEERVSYWRRLVQARLDLLSSPSDGIETDVARIAQAFRATRGHSRHPSYLRIHEQAHIDGMPALRSFWERVDVCEESLSEVEAELGAYRHAIHSALDEASAELISRYKKSPTLALKLLPSLED